VTKKLLMCFIAAMFAASVHAADWYEVYETTTTDGETTVINGAGFLHKVVVSSAGVSSFIAVTDSKDSLDATNQITGINTNARDEWEFNVSFSSGLTYQTYGGNPAAVQFLYRRGGFRPADGGVYESSFTVTADDTASLLSSRSGVLYKVMVTSAAAAGAGLDLFNAIDGGTADSNRIVRSSGDSTFEDTFSIAVSSGLTYTATGTAGWTILYKRGL
jgi:hypothetical protein